MILRENDKLYMACKRPNSINNLEKTIQKARRQIAKRGHGIICLSIDKLLNYDAKVLQIEEHETISEKVRFVMNRFIREWNHKIQYWAQDKKIFGILYYFSCASDFKKENIFTVIQKYYITNRCSNQSPYYKFLEDIEQLFKSN